MEIRISFQHCGQLCLRSVIENVARNAMALGKSKFITHPKRRTGALRNDHIALQQPCGILSVYGCVGRIILLLNAQILLANIVL